MNLNQPKINTTTSDNDSITLVNKFPKYFSYIIAFCILLCVGLLVDRIFLFQKPEVISKITAQVELVVNLLIIIPSLKIYRNAKPKEQKTLLWFVIINIGLLIGDLNGYYYIYFNAADVLQTGGVRFAVFTIIFFLLITAIIIFLYKILKNYVIQIKQQINTLFIFIPMNIIMIVFFLLSINHVNGFMSYGALSQIIIFISLVVAFDFVILCLMCSENKGLRIFLLGIIGLIIGYFFVIFIFFSEPNGSTYGELFQTFTFTYAEIIWFMGLLLNWISVLIITHQADYDIKNWVRRNSSIKSKLVFWCFNMAIIGFLLFFLIIYTFNLISNTILLGLPVFIMIYSAIIIILSIYVGDHFEAPFKKIEKNIRALMFNENIDKIDTNFSTEEFILLQNYIVDAFRYKDEAGRKLFEEQNKFRQVVEQMIHDITSPITSINTIVGKLSINIPENDRVTLRNAAGRIEGISQRLLNKYDNKDAGDSKENLLVSLALLQIMNEKMEEYREAGIIFKVDIDDAHFCFICHNSGIFKRMISNLVNNAVDAVKNNILEKEILITLAVNAGSVIIIIEDNGTGMPQHIQDKFSQGIKVTEGKDDGHGIGLTQVRDAIEFGKGRCEIYASEKCTQISIYFPKIVTPYWIATEITLNKDDTVIILDDDKSIHGAWNNKFELILEKIPTLKIQHFTSGKEVIDYINNLTAEQRQNTFLLTDYELLEQGMNGLDVVEQTKMLRAILVTSYTTHSNIQDKVNQFGIKLLPKELVYAVKIKVDKKIAKHSKIVDIVWVEDQKWFVDNLVKDHYSHLKVDIYYDPISFMEDVLQYPLDTRIILDTYYESPDGTPYMQTGYDLAMELHARGYTKLILYTGEDPKGRAPEYLQVVRKKDIGSTKNLDKI